MRRVLLPAAALGLLAVATSPVQAQDAKPELAPPAMLPEASPTIYKPPLRGAPGGRVGGASRSALRPKAPLPVVELLAPATHAGLSATATPTLYFFVSRPVASPTQFTISAPLQPTPVLEVTIPSPQAAGIYPLRLADYRVRLQPGVVYTWSLSIVLNPRAWSRNIVASATIVFDPSADPGAARAAPSAGRAARLADGGLWYDAVAAAAEAANFDRHAALDALIKQVGLTEAAGYQQGFARP